MGARNVTSSGFSAFWSGDTCICCMGLFYYCDRFPVVEPDDSHTKLQMAESGVEAISRITTPIAAVAVSQSASLGSQFQPSWNWHPCFSSFKHSENEAYRLVLELHSVQGSLLVACCDKLQVASCMGVRTWHGSLCLFHEASVCSACAGHWAIPVREIVPLESAPLLVLRGRQASPCSPPRVKHSTPFQALLHLNIPFQPLSISASQRPLQMRFSLRA